MLGSTWHANTNWMVIDEAIPTPTSNPQTTPLSAPTLGPNPETAPPLRTPAASPTKPHCSLPPHRFLPIPQTPRKRSRISPEASPPPQLSPRFKKMRSVTPPIWNFDFPQANSQSILTLIQDNRKLEQLSHLPLPDNDPFDLQPVLPNDTIVPPTELVSITVAPQSIPDTPQGSIESDSSQNDPTDFCSQPSPQLTRFKGINFRSDWKIQINSTCQTLVIGDSNLKLARHLPSDWQVISFPGLKFEEKLYLLLGLSTGNLPPNIIIAVGMNNRDDPFEKCTKPTMDHILTKLLKNLQPSPTRIFAVGVSAPHMEPFVDRNIRRINEHLAHTFADRFIQPLKSDEIKMTGGTGIHYNQVTVDKIINSIYIHLN